MKKELALAAVVSFAALIGVAATTEAQGAEARCGMTIRGKVKLTQALDCTGQRPPMLVGPRAHLDLNGHYILCGLNDTQNHLRLRGKAALIRNGELRECTLRLMDQGDHHVRSVQVWNLEAPALRIQSQSNEIFSSRFSIEDSRSTPTAATVSIESGNFNVISDSFIYAEYVALSLGNRAVVVNTEISSVAYDPSNPRTALEVRGNFNRIMGNAIWDGCIVENRLAIENMVIGNQQMSLVCD